LSFIVEYPAYLACERCQV